jgi:hypothetical protein
MDLVVTSERGKDEEEAEVTYRWELPIKGGPKYLVFLRAIYVLPELELSSDAVDFGAVVVGQRKRITVQLKNTKMVPVEWVYKPQRDKFGKLLPPWKVSFDMFPIGGILQPGERQRVQVSFTPSVDGPIQDRIQLRITDNQKRKVLKVFGTGHILRTEVAPSMSYVLGPVLPYEQNCLQELLITNPTEYPIEVFNPEFDEKYRTEEDYLREYPDYEEVGGQYMAELPVREAGAPVWKEVVEKVDRIRARKEKEREREEKIAAGEEVEELEDEEEYVEDTSPEMPDEGFPNRVAVDDRVNYVIVGPRFAGSTCVATAMGRSDEMPNTETADGYKCFFAHYLKVCLVKPALRRVVWVAELRKDVRYLRGF